MPLRWKHLREQIQQTTWGARVASRLRGLDLSALGVVGGYVPTVASSVVGLLATLVVLIATALSFAISPGLYRDGLVRLLPVEWRARGAEVLSKLGETLQLWFLGQLVDMVVVTLLVGIGLYLLGIPLAPTLALFAGLLNFVPYIGALVGSLPAILVAAAVSPQLALYTALLFLAVQTLEGNVIAPVIQEAHRLDAAGAHHPVANGARHPIRHPRHNPGDAVRGGRDGVRAHGVCGIGVGAGSPKRTVLT